MSFPLLVGVKRKVLALLHNELGQNLCFERARKNVIHKINNNELIRF